MSMEIEARFANIESRIRAIEERISPPMVTAEPAPGSDAEHPPVGYVLVPRGSGEVIAADWIVWSFDRGPWKPLQPDSVGDRMHGGFHPMARPIPANEGDSRLAESIKDCGNCASYNGSVGAINCGECDGEGSRWTEIVKAESVAIPVGWVLGFPEGANFRYWCKDEKGGGFWGTTARACVTVRDLMITPDPSIPWGEGYEAILPSEAKPGDFALVQFGDDATTARDEWTAYEVIKSWCRDTLAWRRRIPATTPTEPARDLSAEVERLEAELDATKRLLAESLVERDRLKNLHDARKVRIEGFRDILRERLGDLV